MSPSAAHAPSARSNATASSKTPTGTLSIYARRRLNKLEAAAWRAGVRSARLPMAGEHNALNATAAAALAAGQGVPVEAMKPPSEASRA